MFQFVIVRITRGYESVSPDTHASGCLYKASVGKTADFASSMSSEEDFIFWGSEYGDCETREKRSVSTVILGQ